MVTEQQRVNISMLITVILAGAALLVIGLWRLDIDTDVVSSLPNSDPLIADALHIFQHHPMQDQVTVDVGLTGGDLDILVACGREVARMLAASDLFERVGTGRIQSTLPLLAGNIASDLPYLFTQKDLEEKILPLLTPANIEQAFARHQEKLLSIEGIGQADLLARDPLGFKDLVMARLIHLAPTQAVRMHKGELISRDGRHLLVLAVPKRSGTDTAFARKLTKFFTQISRKLEREYAPRGIRVTLTPVGAYRAALDNEEMVRGDVTHAIFFATLGIVVLLLLAFPRPFLGLLSLLPALLGTVAAFFTYSLIHPSISIMVLGFGGAVVSITVDHGIAYLLFLDRPQVTSGREASHEVRSVGLLATLTTVGAFGALTFSSFPIFQQLGLFTALGIGFSFLSVHAIFPRIFPVMKPAASHRQFLSKVVNPLFSLGLTGAFLALLLLLGFSFWSRPRVNVNLSAMNSVSQETRAAEAQMISVWGDIFNKVFLMLEARSMPALQSKEDHLLALLEKDTHPKLTQAFFLPAMVFPGEARRESNFSAWRHFWTPERTADLKRVLLDQGQRWGFSPQAFDPFWAAIENPSPPVRSEPVPAEFYELLGMVPGKGNTPWRQVVSLTLPKSYPAQAFYDRYHQAARIFEPGLFSDRLGRLLFSTFTKLMISIAAAVALLLLLFFLDLRLTFIALLPLVFAVVCTLGSLNLLGRGLDIPALMLAIVILGMGIDYSLFLVRGYQRYGSAADPRFNLIRLTVFMASASTLIGFGVLMSARHTLLESAGVTSFLGIGFSLLGSVLILPPFLENYFTETAPADRADLDIPARVRARYRKLEAYPRMFARFKLRLDPMFSELDQLLAYVGEPKSILDIGCGYGVCANWMVEKYPAVTVHGVDPNQDRVDMAGRTLKDRGRVVLGAAPELPAVPEEVDLALMLDMLHYLNDSDLALSLKRVWSKLAPQGGLIIRVGLLPTRKRPWGFWIENMRIRAAGGMAYYRDQCCLEAILVQSGFEVITAKPSGDLGETVWICARKANPAA